jgi:hypothetical protein
MKRLLCPLIPIAMLAAAMFAIATRDHHRRCVPPPPGEAQLMRPGNNCYRCHESRSYTTAPSPYPWIASVDAQ